MNADAAIGVVTNIMTANELVPRVATGHGICVLRAPEVMTTSALFGPCCSTDPTDGCRWVGAFLVLERVFRAFGFCSGEVGSIMSIGICFVILVCQMLVLVLVLVLVTCQRGTHNWGPPYIINQT